MYKLALLLIIVLLSGCATGPKVIPKTEQFCDMRTETVVERDAAGNVIAEHTVERMVCNDNQIQRLFNVQSGMAPNCGEFTYWVNKGNHSVQRKGVSCQKPDGSWEIVNTAQW